MSAVVSYLGIEEWKARRRALDVARDERLAREEAVAAERRARYAEIMRPEAWGESVTARAAEQWGVKKAQWCDQLQLACEAMEEWLWRELSKGGGGRHERGRIKKAINAMRLVRPWFGEGVGIY